MTSISPDTWKNSDIVDNVHVTLKDAFSQRAKNADKEICIASGYLYLSGFVEVVDSFNPNSGVRILMGNETDIETADELHAGHKAACDRATRRDLDCVESGDTRLSKLYHMVANGTAHVRIYTKSRFHAKAYIFTRADSDDDKAIVGSSNLTSSGLDSNTELNVVHKGSSNIHLLKAWFDAKWAEAEPFDRSLLKIVNESGKLQGTAPDFVGVRGLIREAASEILRTYGPLKRRTRHSIEPLAKFQDDGAAMVERSIDKFGGSILSDSVGLGKTFVAMRVIEDYAADHPDGRILVIAPRSAMSNWKSIITSGQFQVRRSIIDLRSTTQISNYDPEDSTDDRVEIDHLSGCGLVVIDEAHRFRNPGRKNRKNLEEIGTQGKRVMLITATAVNNSVSELTSLIRIFTDGTSLLNHDSRMDIDSFDAYARALYDPKQDANEITRLRSQMSLILRTIMVQRTRSHVRGQVIAGKRIEFVTPRVSTYDCDSLDGKFYSEFEAVVSDISLPHMYIVSEKKGNISALYKVMLYKRLESGIVALDMSLARLVRSQEKLLAALQSGNPRESVEQWWKSSRRSGVDDGNLDDYDEEIGGGVLGRIRSMSDSEIITLRDGLECDIAAVSKFVNSHIVPRRMDGGLYCDPKADAFARILGTLSGKKVLVFTQSVDTAEWLGRVLKSQNHPSYAVVTGQTDDDVRNDVIERFSPRSNPRKDGNVGEAGELSVLVATDTLSEAVNLQDCSNVVNFDLPWNPMVIVQRVGRIDRIGNLGRSHVHNIMPNGALEHFLNLVGTLKGKIDGIMDTVGKEFRILDEREQVDPKRFEQLVRDHPAYTGDVSDAAENIDSKGCVVNDMTVPARTRLEIHGMEMSHEAPNVTPCAAIRVPGASRTLVAMYRIFDRVNNVPLSDAVVSADVRDDGTPGQLREANEDSEEWLDMFDLIEHDGAAEVAAPDGRSRDALIQFNKLYGDTTFEKQRLRYSRPGRKMSSAERALLSRALHIDKTDGDIVETLESFPFKDILFKKANATLMDHAIEWIKGRSDDEISNVAQDIVTQIHQSPGFVPKRKTGDIDFRLVCWCAHEPA